MPWLPKALSSSPSSRPSSSGSSLKSQPRQLTRAKKLRHLQDEDIKDLDLLRSPARDTESSGNDLSRLTAVENRPTQLSSVVPQRLPLPDLASHHSFGDAVSRNSPSAVDYFPLPSPNRALIKGERDREKLKISDVLARDGTAGASTDYTSESRISHQDARGSSDGRRSFDYGETWLSRDVPQKIMGVDNAQENFGIQDPFRSAPTSGYSSPVLSPQRRSTSDLFSSKQMVHQVWSAPEMPTTTTDIASGFPYAAFQEKTMFKSSPNHSPRVKSPMKPRASTSGPASPRNRKLFIETSVTNYESNGYANGHPLPLPPGAISATQSSPIPQSLAKPELLPVKSQWVKGKLIGRGTFGTVYVATNRETGALCAMKEVELFPDDPKSAECLKQLEQEIKVLSQLKHPNIVQYYGSEIVEDRINIYLEYVHPGSINKYIRDHGVAMTESVVRNFTRHILSGLAYLHCTKTIHRDIKGANLLVDAFGVVKLADFGMAKHLSGQAANLSLKGSPYWMAPELMHSVMQKDNNSDLALAVDIWSLGCTIIEMLTGKPPWSEFEGAAAMFKVLRESPPFPETLSSEGKDFLHWCFQRNPADRPSASMLLKHRFVRNSLPLDVPSHLAFNGLNLTDRAYSPRELHGPKLDQMPMTPSRQAAKARLVSNNETGTQSLPETCNLTPIPRHSPQSTLEALPSPSPPRSGHSLTTLLPGPAKHLCFY